MTDLHGIIFAYQANSGLGELTKPRNICSLPFGGRYRLIDFMLSNMVNAGICNIGLVVHQSYQSLMDHVGSGKDWDLSRKHGGLRVLPPFSTVESAHRGYAGTMDALSGVFSYLNDIKQQHVVLAWGDIAANIPLADVYRQHLESGNDVTVVCSKTHSGLPSETKYLRTDETGRVNDIIVSPTEAPDALESLNISILSTKLLLELVRDCASHDVHTFTRGALLPRIDTLRIGAYIHQGYAARFHSVQDYFNRSMDLLDPSVRRQLFAPGAPIRTKEHTDPSTYYSPDSHVSNSLVSDGCVIEGTVENSVLSRGVVIKKGATVRNCVLMRGVTVEADTSLSYCIADKHVHIGAGHDLSGHASFPIAIGKNTTI